MTSVATKPRSIATTLGTAETVRQIILEMSATHMERRELLNSLWVAMIARQHLLMVGPGGTGKSFLCRDFAGRIEGSNYFELALDEATTKDELLGPINIKHMVDSGRTRRVFDGMLPTAHIAFLDEFFNANGPSLHATMPILNERVAHNDGEVTLTPLRIAVLATNKLNSDADLAALWDRVHLRHYVGYVSDRDNLASLVNDAVKRAITSYTPPARTTVTLTELDAAHDEALSLPISKEAQEVFLDLREELGRAGVIVGTRRMAEARKTIAAAAWLAGHSEIMVADLSILRHMFWSRQEDANAVKNIVLAACNPAEKAALDALIQLDQLRDDWTAACTLDDIKRNNAAIDLFKKAQQLLDRGDSLHESAVEAGAGTQRIDELIESSRNLRHKIGTIAFGMSPAEIETEAQNLNRSQTRRVR